MASLCNVSLDQFWTLTPFAFSLIADAHKQKSEYDKEYERWLTWHQAALPRMKKFMPLKDFVRPKENCVKVGVDEAAIKARLKAYQNASNSESMG